MSNTALLPNRHQQTDFFIPDIFDSLPVKNDYHTMEHPFFALSTKPDIREVRYNRNGVDIKLNPHNTLGLPTMFDKDILLYCGSLVIAELKKNPSVYPSRKLRFSCHDLLITTNRQTNGKSYQLLKNAFERLKGVSITTNIKTNEIKCAAGFGLIDSWYIVEKSDDNSRMVKIEVTLSAWYYNALISKEVLTINRDYFRLRKGLERRLYELARKHCGYQSSWKILLSNLYEKSGSRSELKKFRFQIREIIATDAKVNHFPDYALSLDAKDMVTFKRKEAVGNEKNGNQKLIPVFLPYLERHYAFRKLQIATMDKASKMITKSKLPNSLENLTFQFIAHVEKSGEPESYDGAFIGFIKHKIKGHNTANECT